MGIDRDGALRLARGWLRQREFTRFEIRAALLRAGLPAAESGPVLEALTASELLDDRRTAWRHVLRRSARLRGPDIILRELLERGVQPELARQLVATIPDAEWRRYAGRVLQRYYGREAEERPPGRGRGGGRRRRPLHDPAAFLRMRGFRPRDIEAVLATEAVD